jgi:hypothetical protein
MSTRLRHTLTGVVSIALTCILGLGSRQYAAELPRFVGLYAGDALWALALFLVLRLILPGQATGRVAALAYVLSVLVEISQVYHAPWIDSIRQTRLGGLILGFGFLWSDLACYAVGVGMGLILEACLTRLQRRWTNLPT